VRSPLILALVLVGLVWIAGCGPKGPKNLISGTVTVEGKPVAGKVVFIGPDGTEKESALLGGKYTLPDPTLGENQILVKPLLGAGGPMPTLPMKGPEMPGVSSTGAGEPPPAKYGSSPALLKVNVTGGQQTHDIALQAK